MPRLHFSTHSCGDAWNSRCCMLPLASVRRPLQLCIHLKEGTLCRDRKSFTTFSINMIDTDSSYRLPRRGHPQLLELVVHVVDRLLVSLPSCVPVCEEITVSCRLSRRVHAQVLELELVAAVVRRILVSEPASVPVCEDLMNRPSFMSLALTSKNSRERQVGPRLVPRISHQRHHLGQSCHQDPPVSC